MAKGVASVGEALRKAGVPGWIAGPAAVYGAPRRLRVEGVLGDPWVPTSCILFGCGLAVFVPRVLLVPWDAATEAKGDTATRRAYVDDLTFWRRGPDATIAEDVARVLAVTRRLELAIDWDVKAGESRQFANVAGLRRWLAARRGGCPPPPLSRTYA